MIEGLLTPTEGPGAPGPTPPATERGQLVFPGLEAERAPSRATAPGGPQQPHGTPGSTAAAGTAEAKAPPVRGPEPTAAKGGENYAKDKPVREAGGGMNVGAVDPTLAHAVQGEPRPGPGERAAPPPAAREPAAPGRGQTIVERNIRGTWDVKNPDGTIISNHPTAARAYQARERGAVIAREGAPAPPFLRRMPVDELLRVHADPMTA